MPGSGDEGGVSTRWRRRRRRRLGARDAGAEGDARGDAARSRRRRRFHESPSVAAVVPATQALEAMLSVSDDGSAPARRRGRGDADRDAVVDNDAACARRRQRPHEAAKATVRWILRGQRRTGGWRRCGERGAVGQLARCGQSGGCDDQMAPQGARFASAGVGDLSPPCSPPPGVSSR
jgi:hypothetical protein